ncbi:uncharacterized protein LOC122795066 [Protopterus annectens]|uniref:uncharacterized protein LOC122795066 n=1 Tax=Protopterus annectens TaxID=7888 RepID=UPI001CFC2DE0|nr:uncharacterized protein LOC122795066 [Protopterus annectens]
MFHKCLHFFNIGVSWNSEGTEFITAFMQNYEFNSYYNYIFQLSITALNPSTTVHVIIFNTSFDVTLTLGEWETATVPLPSSIQLIGTTRSSTSTVAVKSNKPITILSENYEQYTADTSTILPVNYLGTEYYIFAPKVVFNTLLSQFVIINYNKTNDIFITLTGSIIYNGLNYNPGDNLTITLSAFEAIQLQSSVILTSTRIHSQYPIAVLSGNKCISYNSACDLVFEQLIPLIDWGATFLVSSVAVNSYADIVTIIASQKTDIQYTTGGITNNITLLEGNYSEISLPSNSFLAMNATQPIMVMYTYTGGSGNHPTDPFIMNVIPLESLSSSYVISTDFKVYSYVRVIAKMSKLLEIFSSNQAVSYTPAWNIINGTNYSWTDIVLGSVNQSFILQHCSSTFAAYIYGTGSSVSIGTIAPAINRSHQCETADVTVRSMANGSVFVNWTNDACAENYILTLTKSDNPAFTEEKVINGSSTVFTGQYASSDYFIAIQAMIRDITCLPLLKPFTHFDFSWSSAGTQFITAFVQNNINSNLEVSHLAITALSPSTSVQVIIYNTSFEDALTLGEGETSFVNIPAWAELRGTILSSHSTVIVRSDKPITVLSFSYKYATADSANIFPVDTLGTEYYVFAPIGGYGMSEFAVINYNQTNELQITVAGALVYNGSNYNSGDNITLVLSAFDVIQLQSTTVLTGTRIQSEYPVAVLSGNNCDRYNGACDVMFEQLLPVNEWGKKFLVASIAVQGYTDIVTVVASQRTEISYSTGNWSNSIELHQGQSTTISLSSSSSLYLNATEPVMVMYTFTGGYYNWDTVDPFVMNILPFESFSSSYIINTENNFSNYIQLIAEASVISEILQSNNLLSNASIQGNVPMTDYAWAKIELGQRNNSFIIKHCSAFAVYMYGTLSSTGFGTTALAINGTHLCDSLDLTVTSMANGAIQANWTKVQCVDSYLLQLNKADNSSVLEQKIVSGSSMIFTGPYDHSVYNVTLWTMHSYEQCPPLEKQVTHFGKKATVIAKAEVLAIGREPIDDKVLKNAVENELYNVLKPKLHQFVKVRVIQV